MDENVKMEGTPLTLEECLECQANEIKTKEQQIEQLKAENDHWQEICADLHIEYGEQIEAQQQIIDDYAQSARVIALYLKNYCDEKLSYAEMIAEAARKADSKIQAQQQDIESLQRELNAEISVNEALTADKDEQAQTIMRVDTAAKQAAEILNDMCDVAISRGMAYLYAKDTDRVRKLANALLGGAEDGMA